MVDSGAIEYFAKFVKNQGISIVQSFYEDNDGTLRKIGDKDAENQLYIISEFHKKVMGYNQYMANRLVNKTGRTVELYKVNIKRIKRYIKNLNVKKEITPFEIILLEKGEAAVRRAEECISNIFSSGYIDIIGRSMKRNEICIGKTDFMNLRRSEKIEIISLEGCCYNMVEMDGIQFLNRLRRRGIELDYKTLVKKYCDFEGLSENSEKMIIALMSYPRDFMRCANRYRENKKEWSEEEYIDNLNRAVIRDGDNLL